MLAGGGGLSPQLAGQVWKIFGMAFPVAKGTEIRRFFGSSGKIGPAVFGKSDATSYVAVTKI